MEFYKIRIKYLFKTAEVIIPVKNQFLQGMGLISCHYSWHLYCVQATLELSYIHMQQYNKSISSHFSSLMATTGHIAFLKDGWTLELLIGPFTTPWNTSPKQPSPSLFSMTTRLAGISHSSSFGESRDFDGKKTAGLIGPLM